MKPMDIDSKQLRVPVVESEAVVKMLSAEFARFCKDLSTIGDTVVISVTKESIKFSSKGDTKTAYIVCRRNTSVDKPEDAAIIKMQKPVSLTFQLRFMNSFTKATPLANQVTISLSSELPIMVEYKIAEMGYINYYLAPKQENLELTQSLYKAPVQQPRPNAPNIEAKTEEESKITDETNSEIETDCEAETDDEVELWKPSMRQKLMARLKLWLFCEFILLNFIIIYFRVYNWHCLG